MDITITSVGVNDLFAKQFQMKAYPNPFNGVANISFELLEPSNVNLSVYDITGRLVQTIVNNEQLKSGKLEYIFDAEKNQISASVYIISLKVNDQTQFIRLVEGSGK
jgi:hypothetical protein